LRRNGTEANFFENYRKTPPRRHHGGFGFSIVVPQSASEANLSDPLLLNTTKVCKGYLRLGSELKKKSFRLLLLVKSISLVRLLLLVKTIFSAHYGDIRDQFRSGEYC
jgi:hypothetical protein